MDVNVFVSSTCRDMEQDCRPAVLSGIKLADDLLKSTQAGRAAAVAMEDWDADYQPALELCLEKIRIHSTHYVGVLGYLRGFVPGSMSGATQSITEEEWRHALTHCGRKCIAMFIPEDGSPIAQVLKQRVEDLQTKAELEAQLLFREQVLRGGAAQQFKDVVDLSQRVSRKVFFWGNGGLRQTARVARPAGASGTSAPARPQARLDLTELGRLEQYLMFRKGLQELSPSGVKRARAFFLYGPRGLGHGKAAERLVRVVEESAVVQPRCYVVRAGTLWRDGSQVSLLRVLAREIRPGWEPDDVPELAMELLNLIGDRDVVLQISGLEDYAGGAEAFHAHFWAPLVQALPDSLPHRLICLAAVETKAKKLQVSALGGAPAAKQDPWLRPVVLPRLAPFTAEELCFWLKSRLPAPDAESLSAYLMTKTDGVPDALYEFLANRALWEL